MGGLIVSLDDDDLQQPKEVFLIIITSDDAM
jgi:hypothetical protein